MNSLPEDPMEQGQEGGARLRVVARMDRCMCGCGIKVLSLSAKDLLLTRQVSAMPSFT